MLSTDSFGVIVVDSGIWVPFNVNDCECSFSRGTTECVVDELDGSRNVKLHFSRDDGSRCNRRRLNVTCRLRNEITITVEGVSDVSDGVECTHQVRPPDSVVDTNCLTDFCVERAMLSVLGEAVRLAVDEHVRRVFVYSCVEVK